MIDLSNKDYLELKDKAEKWDKLHTETRQAPEKKRPTLREEELEAQVKSLQEEIMIAQAHVGRLVKNKEIISKIRYEVSYAESIRDGINSSVSIGKLKEILGDES